MQRHNKKKEYKVKLKSHRKGNIGMSWFLIIGILFVVAILFGIPSFSSRDEGNEFEEIVGGVVKTLKEDYRCKNCNVIIISVTNLRNDHLGYNGYFRDTSSNIDKFAAKSLIFENAFSHASWTLPAGISFFTSLYPFTHGVMNRWTGDILSKDIVGLPDILEDNGYVTAAFTGGFDYDGQYGLISRFNYSRYPDFEADNHITGYGNFNSNLPQVIEWIRKNKEEKFMLFFQGFDVHCPFTPPVGQNIYDKTYNGNTNFSECLWTFEKINSVIIKNKTYFNVKTPYKKGKGYGNVRLDEADVYHMISLYDSEIKNTDKVLKQLFDEIIKLELDKNTVIILFSEHGDLFGEHGRFMRGGPLRGTFYDEVLNVPLLIYHPTLNPKRVDGLVQLIDVMPTLLDFLGIKKYESFEGKSLVPLIKDGKEINQFVLAKSNYTPKENNAFYNLSTVITAIRTKDFKLTNEKIFNNESVLEFDSYEFFDLTKDPNELINIYLTADTDLIAQFNAELENIS